MDDKQWLQELKVGDDVLESQPYGSTPILGKVSRITKATIFIRRNERYEQGFRKIDGHQVGADRWHRQYLKQPTPERYARARINKLTNTVLTLKNRIVIPKDEEGLLKLITAITPFTE